MASSAAASATQLLRDCTLPQLRTLDVSETDEEVVLQGHVVSYYHKQLAQETVIPALGVRRLRNLVVVANHRPFV